MLHALIVSLAVRCLCGTVNGPIYFTDTELNEQFPPFRLFDESVSEVEMLIYELHPDEITGRKTTD